MNSATPAPKQLLVEGRPRPQTIGTPHPLFGWKHQLGVVRQDAYEIRIWRVDDGTDALGTGRRESADSVFVDVLAGELTPDTDYEWEVRIWADGQEQPSPWVRDRFSTTLFNADGWVGRWVEPAQESVVLEPADDFQKSLNESAPSAREPVQDRLHPAPFIRQEVHIPGTPVRARLFATARGVYVPSANGQRVSDETLAPGYDAYQGLHSFQTYDLTHLIVPGANVLGFILGDGWWAGRISFLGQSANYGTRLQLAWELRVSLAGGNTLAFGSDGTSRSSAGPVVYSDIFVGEKWDARLALGPWDQSGFDDSGWLPVTVADTPGDTLRPSTGDPIRTVMEFAPVEIIESPAGETIVDLGQNIAGRLRITASGPRGTEIRLEHSEVLDGEGSFVNNISGRNKDQTDVFVLAGEGDETYEPLMTYHGFRYVRVTGYPGPLTTDKITAVVLSTDSPRVGRFNSSDARLNRLHENVVWSQRSNFLSIPTDCPQRERAGWTGDAQVFAPSATNNFDVLSFYRHWLDNVRVEQLGDGQVPSIVPYTPSFASQIAAGSPDGNIASTGWADAIVLVPWTLYQRYGDRRVLEENFEAMKRWHAYCETEAATKQPDGLGHRPPEGFERYLLNTGSHLGDWLAPSLVPDDSFESMMIAPARTGRVFASAFFAESTRVIASIAGILGDSDTAHRLSELYGNIRAAFRQEYLDESGAITPELQGPYVVALAFDLVPEELVEASVGRLVALIEANDNHLDTGFLSIPYLLEVLSRHGRDDVALKLLWQNSQPSWMHEVDQGATTIWEAWRSYDDEGEPLKVSFNHYAFGVVDDWLYTRLAGIAPQSPGYARSVIRPVFDTALRFVDASIDTPYGTLAVNWLRVGSQHVRLDIEVPPNSTAEVVGGRQSKTIPLEAGIHQLFFSIQGSELLGPRISLANLVP